MIDEDRLWIYKNPLKIFDPICENDAWRILYNHEVYRKFKHLNIARVIKSYWIRWLGKFLDMRTVCKIVTFAGVQGTRKRGRFHIRWINCLEANLKTLKIRRWRTIESDRNHWIKPLRRPCPAMSCEKEEIKIKCLY